MQDTDELDYVIRGLTLQNIIKNYKEQGGKEDKIERLEKILYLIQLAIKKNSKAIKILTGLNGIPDYPQRCIDDEGNVFIYKGILFENLNFRWKQFDEKHKGSLKINYYLEGLNTFLQKTNAIRGAKVKYIYTMTKNQLEDYLKSPSNIPKELYNKIYSLTI